MCSGSQLCACAAAAVQHNAHNTQNGAFRQKMSSSFLACAEARASDAVRCLYHSTPSTTATQQQAVLINCLMLVTWPRRCDMIQEAIASFVCQDYPHRILTVVNDGTPCKLMGEFAAGGSLRGSVVQVAPGSSIGEKRNLGARAVPEASYVASFDDDDFSLPGRLSAHLAAIGTNVWLSASRKYISITTLQNIIGFEMGRCYGAGMISTRITAELPWPPLSYCEDHKLYETVKAHPQFGAQLVEDDALMYVHRRHETNASAAHRQSLWQGALPLMIAGADAVAAPRRVASLLAAMAREPYLISS